MRETLKIKLYTSYYHDSAPARQEENRRCLQNNIENALIDEIVLFVDGLEPYKYLESGKVRLALTAAPRTTYKDFIDHANREGEPFILLMANTDIYFDRTLEILREAIGASDLFCLGRRDVRPDGSAPHTEHYASSDAWAMIAPVKELYADIRLGIVHCESTFLGHAQQGGYRVRNIGLDVSAFHLHITQKRNYNPNVDCYRDYESMIYPELGAIPKAGRSRAGSPRIVLDGAVFQTNRLNWCRYWMNVLEQWNRDGFGKQVTVLDRAGSAPKLPALNYHPAPVYNPNLPVTSCLVLQHLLNDLEAQAFVSTCYTSPIDTPALGFIYDMVPETLNANLEQFRDKLSVITQAERFCVPCLSTGRALREFSARVGEDLLDVAPPGVPDGFGPSPAALVDQFKQRLGLDRPYFLFVGDRSGYCNHPNAEVLCRAFNRMPGKERFLILFVGGHPELEPKLLATLDRSNIRQAYVDDRDLVNAYSGALALVSPGLAPRLGLSALEAMRCRCPVIAAREALSPDISSDCVLQFSAADADQLARLLTLAQDRSLRERMSTSGYQHSFKFSWRDTADRIKAALLEVAG